MAGLEEYRPIVGEGVLAELRLLGERLNPVLVDISPANVNDDVATLGPAEAFQSLSERRQASDHLRVVFPAAEQHADPAHTLLGPHPARLDHGDRPCCGDTEESHELPTSHQSPLVFRGARSSRKQ